MGNKYFDQLKDVIWTVNWMEFTGLFSNKLMTPHRYSLTYVKVQFHKLWH